MSLTQRARSEPAIRLVATDLDGTLLRDDGSVSPYTRRVLARTQATGVTLALVSARPPRTLRPIADAVGARGLALCCNGALVYDLATDRTIHHRPLAGDTARRLIAALRQTAPDLCFAARIEDRFIYEPGFGAIDPAPLRPEDVGPEALAWRLESLTKLIVLHPWLAADTLLEMVRAAGGSEIEATHTGTAAVEVSAAGVHKGAALAGLCAEMGITPDEVIAFGDMPNDLPMLAWAGRGVAVANAHPTVLQAADQQTLSNQEDGVAVALERLLPVLRLH